MASEHAAAGGAPGPGSGCAASGTPTAAPSGQSSRPHPHSGSTAAAGALELRGTQRWARWRWSKRWPHRQDGAGAHCSRTRARQSAARTTPSGAPPRAPRPHRLRLGSCWGSPLLVRRQPCKRLVVVQGRVAPQAASSDLHRPESRTTFGTLETTSACSSLCRAGRLVNRCPSRPAARPLLL